MTKCQLPQHPHIEHLRKEAKQRFAQLKARASGARLADAQYWLARDYGFVNWRALKEEVLRRMGVVRMAPLPSHAPARFRRDASSVDEDLETDGYFQRGAAVTGIGLVAALLIAAMALLFAGRAFGQTVHAAATSPQPMSVIAVTRDGNAHYLVLTYGSGRISAVAILNWP